MNSIPPDSSRLEEDKAFTPKETEKRPLSGEEEEVEKLSSKILEKKTDTETQVVESEKEISSPTPEEKKVLEESGIVSKAVESVESEKISIHDKWASPIFKEIVDNEGGDFFARISAARIRIAEVKEMYRPILARTPPTTIQREAAELLKNGSLVSEKGGKGGVYFLLDTMGKPKFVIKPGDESNLALNNGKKFASPFLEDDGIRPVKGVKIYEATQNAELAYFAAELFGLQEITPKTEVMIIEHPAFHDLLDGTSEKMDPLVRKMEEALPASKEKVCAVQVFIEGCWDIGSLLCSQSKLEPEEIKRMMKEDREEYEKLELKHSPRDLDHDMYEKIVIFSFIIGEKDGNAGNLICSKAPVPEMKKRPLYKIDNAASFPEQNDDLRSGLSWAVHNYSLELSSNAKAFIKGIDPEKVNTLKREMELRGKNPESIQAFEKRIEYLQAYAPLAKTVEELDLYLTDHEW